MQRVPLLQRGGTAGFRSAALHLRLHGGDIGVDPGQAICPVTTTLGNAPIGDIGTVDSARALRHCSPCLARLAIVDQGRVPCFGAPSLLENLKENAAAELVRKKCPETNLNQDIFFDPTEVRRGMCRTAAGLVERRTGFLNANVNPLRHFDG